jgi:hypothetical protein
MARHAHTDANEATRWWTVDLKAAPNTTVPPTAKTSNNEEAEAVKIWRP